MYQIKTHSTPETTDTTRTGNLATTTRTPTSTLDAWARHAISSNGFGDAFTFDTDTLPFTTV